jgi:TAT (twin-arginine translocation) pathway-exported protein
MRLIDKTPKVSRRTVLKTGGVTAAAAALVPAAAISGKAWAAAPVAVSADEFATLVKMARDIYPHDRLGDQYYAKVIEGLDSAAKDDAAAKTLLKDGVAALNNAAIGMKYGSYNQVPSEDERVAILQSMETTPFFQKIRGTLITGIYNNQDVWPIMGYEGESASKGGYINRGFNDIDWLDKA